MTRELMLGMLRKGETGDQILSILDVITSFEPDTSEDEDVTADEW